MNEYTDLLNRLHACDKEPGCGTCIYHNSDDADACAGADALLRGSAQAIEQLLDRARTQWELIEELRAANVKKREEVDALREIVAHTEEKFNVMQVQLAEKRRELELEQVRVETFREVFRIISEGGA